MKPNEELMLLYLSEWFRRGGRRPGGREAWEEGHPTRMGRGGAPVEGEGDAHQGTPGGGEVHPWGKKPLLS